MRDIQKTADQIAMNRSRYQIERFVAGQHHLPEMQYRQLVIEAITLCDSIAETKLRIRKTEAEAEELFASDKKSDRIEAEIKLLAIPSLKRTLKSSERELSAIEELLSRYPEYTREDIEAAQEQYWEERLVRTARFQAMSGSVNWAQIEAIWQAGLLPELLQSNPLEGLMEVETPMLPKGEDDG